jgi:hypothetical protein
MPWLHFSRRFSGDHSGSSISTIENCDEDLEKKNEIELNDKDKDKEKEKEKEKKRNSQITKKKNRMSNCH